MLEKNIIIVFIPIAIIKLHMRLIAVFFGLWVWTQYTVFAQTFAYRR